MRRSLLPLALALLASPGGALGQAQARETIEQTQHGVWSMSVLAPRGTRAADSCVKLSYRGDRTLAIAHNAGNHTLGFIVSRDLWRIPPGTEVAMRVTIGSQFWTWTGVGTRDLRGLRASIPQQETGRAFFDAWRAGAVVTIAFPDGSEPAWSFSLTGSSASLDVFARCVARVEAAGTQPHDAMRPPPRAQAPTQPHQPTPSPSPVPGTPERRT